MILICLGIILFLSFEPTNIAIFDEAVKPLALNFAISAKKSFHLFSYRFGGFRCGFGESLPVDA